MIRILVFMFLINSVTGFAKTNETTKKAKEVAAQLKKDKNKPDVISKKVSPEKMSDDDLNKLICPRVATQFVSASENSLRAMHDLYDTLFEVRNRSSEFYLTLLELDKTIPEHEEAAGKIIDIKSGIDQKLSRAKLNYNQELKNLATNTARAKKCWDYHEGESKKTVGRFLEIFQQEAILEDFKKCVSILERNNRIYISQLKLSVNYYNKAITKSSLISEASKLDKEIRNVVPYENKQCDKFTKNGEYGDYFNGKYDHKTIANSPSKKESSASNGGANKEDHSTIMKGFLGF